MQRATDYDDRVCSAEDPPASQPGEKPAIVGNEEIEAIRDALLHATRKESSLGDPAQKLRDEGFAINEQPARFRFLSGFLFDFVELRRMFKPPKRFALEIHRALGRLLN